MPGQSQANLASGTAVAANDAGSTALDSDRDHSLTWVWREVRKRVFLKIPFSQPVAHALEAVVPIALDGDTLVCGLPSAQYSLAGYLSATQVRNTIESILQNAAGQRVRFDLIEGVSTQDWIDVKERRNRAHDAIVAIAEQTADMHHFETVLNQVVGEIRQRVTSTRDRLFPQVRAGLVLDIVPLLADTEEMLFPEPESHDARRAMARAIDRVASFLDYSAMELALEIERYRRKHHVPRRAQSEAKKTL